MNTPDTRPQPPPDAAPKPVEYECACCGEFFQSTPQEQLIFDCDPGEGFCPRCAHFTSQA